MSIFERHIVIMLGQRESIKRIYNSLATSRGSIYLGAIRKYSKDSSARDEGTDGASKRLRQMES